MKALVGRFNQEKAGPSKGLLRYCEIFADGSFAALLTIPVFVMTKDHVPADTRHTWPLAGHSGSRDKYFY